MRQGLVGQIHREIEHHRAGRPARIRMKMNSLVDEGVIDESLVKFEAAIQKPWGMVLVTGPTGSGKTNTLYSSIAKVNTSETNIMTAEDPVEFNLPGINQVQVRENIGLNFAAALRSFLRQDPNIILVGEIRDFETAEIAVKAALTGHLVLSTLHTIDASKTVDRIVDVFPAAEKEMVRAMLSESLVSVISQTLLKTKDGQGRVAAPPVEAVGLPVLQTNFFDEVVRRWKHQLRRKG